MSKIISIGTAVPAFQHEQNRILTFMQEVYRLDAVEARKLKFLYRQSGIDYRYSAIADFSKDAADWNFFPPVGSADPIPSIEKRMNLYGSAAAPMAK